MRFATSKFLPVLLCILFFQSFSQIEIKNYSKDDGLTSNTIITSKVDSKGILWVGTNHGISAFTGEGWIGIKSITERDGGKKPIGRVNIIYEATNGDIWVMAEKGIFIFNGSYWTHYYDREFYGYIVTDIFEDRRGMIWVMFEKYQNLKDVGDLGFSLVEGTIQMYSSGQWHRFHGKIGGSAAVQIGDPNEYFTSYIQDYSGNIWVTSLDGTYKFDGYDWEEFNEEQLPTDICYSVFQAKNKQIWVATKHGIATQIDDKWIKYEKQKGIKGNNIVSIFEDNNNQLWFTALKDNRLRNLCVYNNDSWSSFSRDNIGLKGEIVDVVSLDNSVSVFSKKGIYKLIGKKWNNLLKVNSIHDNNFSNLLKKRDKSFLFSGEEGLYQLNEMGIVKIYDYPEEWKVNFIREDKNMNIWIGTERDGLFLFKNEDSIQINEESGLADNQIQDLTIDREGNIWVITGYGISKLIIK